MSWISKQKNFRSAIVDIIFINGQHNSRIIYNQRNPTQHWNTELINWGFSCCWRTLVGLWMDRTSLRQTCTAKTKQTQISKTFHHHSSSYKPNKNTKLTLCWLYFSLTAGRVETWALLHNRWRSFTHPLNSNALYCV